MKIVILVRILWASGAQKVAIEEAKKFKQLGHDIKLVFLRKTNSGNVYLPLLEGIDWAVMAEDSSSFFTPIYDRITGLFMPDRRGEGRVDYDLIRAFPEYIINYKPELIICHDQWAGLAGYYTFRKYGIKYVTILHESVGEYNVPVLGRIADRYEKTVLKKSQRVFTINERIEQSLESKWDISAIVNYHGMDSEEKRDYLLKEDLILLNSSWDANRASKVYLEILESLPNFEMKMVGRWIDSSLKTKYEKLVAQYKLKDRLELLENLGERELMELYIRSKYLIRFGYRENGNPHGIIDSISHGTVPILNSELGIATIIRKYEAGIVVDSIDSVPVVEAITRTNNPIEYSKIQENMNELSTTYTWKNHCELFLENL